MPTSPRAVFAFDRENWCSVFSSVEDAENGVETNDVDADEYVVFGDDGTVFDARVEGVRVRLSATDVRQLPQLQERLALFLRANRIDCASDDVIAAANAILEAEWEGQWPRRPRWLARRLYGDAPPAV